MISSCKLDPFSDVLSAFKSGRMVLMVDDEKRENEGDLIIATEAVTSEAVAFMMNEGRGLICVTVAVDLAQRLNLPLQTLANNSLFQTPFAVSIDHNAVAAEGVTARSRAFTMLRMLSSDSSSAEFSSPGHVFPLIANPAGVLGRQGQTEGSYDMARLAGFQPSAVLCELLNRDGTMARGGQVNAFADKHGLTVTSVGEVIRYRIQREVLVREIACSELNTDFGLFVTKVFIDDADGKEHLALIYGDQRRLQDGYGALVRIHSECLTGDVFGSRRCDCGTQLHMAMRKVSEEGCGAIVYLRQEGRGIGLANKMRAYALQDEGRDTVEANVHLGFPADMRDYAVAAKILGSLGINTVRLMTNNPDKVAALQRLGVLVKERVPSVVLPDDFNRDYLQTKKEKLGHLL